MISNGAGNRIIGDKVDKYSGVDLVLLGSNLSHYWDNSDINKQIHPQTAVTFIQFEEDLFNQQFVFHYFLSNSYSSTLGGEVTY